MLAAVTSLTAQVIIGEEKGTAAVKTSILLEFAAGQNKRIIVPYVRTISTAAALVGGCIILDSTYATTAKMKCYNGKSWTDLSGQVANLTSILTNQPTIEQAPELATFKAIIGS